MPKPASVGSFTLDSELRFLSVEASDGALLPSDTRKLLGQSVWSVFQGPLKKLLYPGICRAQRESVAVRWEAVHPESDVRYVFEIQPGDGGYAVRFHAATEVPVAESRPPVATTDDEYFSRAADMLVVLSATEGKILRANPAWNRTLGFPIDALAERSLLDLTHPDDRSDAYAALQHTLRTDSEAPIRFTCRIRNAAGEYCYFQWLATPRPEADQVYAAARDVTESRTAELAMRKQASTDPLTELLNRRGLEEELTRAIIAALKGSRFLAVAYIDLDRFKPINDSLGHDVGDQMLQVVARRLAAAVRTGDLVARLGGDEFIVVLTGIATPDDAKSVAEKLLASISAPATLAGHELYVTASIGVSLCPTDGHDAVTLLKRADEAMRRVKSAEKSGVRLFSQAGVSLYSATESDALTESVFPEEELKYAIERDQLKLVYQEQRSAKTGQIVGFEALLRWEHPDLGHISPAKFIPIAEESGLIVAIGVWVIREALREGRIWLSVFEGLKISVNVSPKQFQDGGDSLVEAVASALHEFDFPASCLELEITETALADDEEALTRTLNRLKDLGVKLSIDDFGAGYSSYSLLAKLPVDVVKIDRSLVSTMCENRRLETVVKAIIDLAHTLGMGVVAEGIETEAQHEKLLALGCNVFQGFFFGKPLASSEVPLLLSSKRA